MEAASESRQRNSNFFINGCRKAFLNDSSNLIFYLNVASSGDCYFKYPIIKKEMHFLWEYRESKTFTGWENYYQAHFYCFDVD